MDKGSKSLSGQRKGFCHLTKQKKLLNHIHISAGNDPLPPTPRMHSLMTDPCFQPIRHKIQDVALASMAVMQSNVWHSFLSVILSEISTSRDLVIKGEEKVLGQKTLHCITRKKMEIMDSCALVFSTNKQASSKCRPTGKSGKVSRPTVLHYNISVVGSTYHNP